MLRCISPILAILVLIAIFANAQAVMPDEGCPGDYDFSFDIVAFDTNQKIAMKEANAILANDIQVINDNLGDDCAIASVVTQGHWDGEITYTLTVTVFVSCDCD